MSRGLTTANLNEATASSLQAVVLCKIELDTPQYVHSGIGPITFDSNVYQGIGDQGSISGIEESDDNSPQPIQLALSGIDSANIAEALNSANYGDMVTIYVGYRQDDGTLVDDPWTAWGGYIEYTSTDGDSSSVILHCAHYLTILSKKNGRRYTDEDQQREHPNDLGLQYIDQINGKSLTWGAESRVSTPYAGGRNFDGGTNIRER